MAADIQHADAIMLVQHLENSLLKDHKFLMTYADAAVALGRNPATESRHVGQVVSRIDAACFYARLPFIGMHRIRETETEEINPRTFDDDLWGPHRQSFIERADRHVWTADDFKRIKTALHSLGDDSAQRLWERIDGHGEKAVRKALSH